MRPILTRRRLLGGFTSLALMAPMVACSRSGEPGAAADPSPSLQDQRSRDADFEALEEEFDATLGIYAIDTGTGQELSHNADERFGYASTFKALAAGAILRKYTLAGIDEVVHYSTDDLVAHAPVTEHSVDTGMSLRELCDAAVRYSDNTAANLLLEKLGGPSALNAVLEELGDDVTRMERYEPGLSDITAGDTSDTSTPRAFATDLRAFVLGDVLETPEREALTEWLRTNTTTDELIPAGVPDEWTVAGKSGAGGTYGIRNNIAVAWPPSAEPIVVAIMSKRPDKDAEYDNALIARAATVIAEEFA